MNLNNAIRAGITIAAAMIGMMGAVKANPASMVIIGEANPPIGAYQFCRDYPNDCRNPAGDAGELILTEERWKEILRINYQVNSTIRPATDMEVYGVEEHWDYPKTAGDCEDYALLKRKMLIEAGISPSDLLMTVVLQPSGEGHAVLTVRTDRGDFILDNMRNKVMLWSDTEYTYLKRQATANPARWVKLQDGRAVAVGSVR